MCDYSLHAVASRPAEVGDHLITSKFSNTFTHGFALEGQPDVAVCLLPGTEVAFCEEAKRRGFWRAKSMGQKTAIFRKVDELNPYSFHDALEFADGQIILLTQLCENQRAIVLQLPALPTSKSKRERVAPVRVDAHLKALGVG